MSNEFRCRYIVTDGRRIDAGFRSRKGAEQYLDVAHWKTGDGRIEYLFNAGFYVARAGEVLPIGFESK